MANGPPNISYAMSHIVPFQDNLMRYLNRSDLRAMSHASIPVPISRRAQRKNLLRVRCEQTEDGPPHRRCRERYSGLVRMRDCVGSWLEEGVGFDPSPTRDRFGYWNGLVQEDHTPGFEICDNCRIDYYNHFAQLEMNDIQFGFWMPMCKWHSLKYFKKRPVLNFCRCFELLDASWQCNGCRVESFVTLESRMVTWKDELMKVHRKRERRGRVYFDKKIKRVRPACPIPKCGEKPWEDSTAIEGMDMCLACCNVQPSFGYVQAQQVQA